MALIDTGILAFFFMARWKMFKIAFYTPVFLSFCFPSENLFCYASASHYRPSLVTNRFPP